MRTLHANHVHCIQCKEKYSSLSIRSHYYYVHERLSLAQAFIKGREETIAAM